MNESEIKYYYSNNGPERGGIITNRGIVELKNIAEVPEDNFEISDDDLIKLDDPNTLATFHTHPNKSSNLSVSDYVSFLNYPRLLHYIVGKQGLRKFRVLEDFVIEES